MYVCVCICECAWYLHIHHKLDYSASCRTHEWNLAALTQQARVWETQQLHDSSPSCRWGACAFLAGRVELLQPAPALPPERRKGTMDQPSMICGGPCCHCSRTASPCWRRGPPEKPVLCNACGTRYSVKRSLEGYFPGRKVQKRRTWRSKDSVEDSASMMIGSGSKRSRVLSEMYVTKAPKNRKRGGALRYRKVHGEGKRVSKYADSSDEQLRPSGVWLLNAQGATSESFLDRVRGTCAMAVDTLRKRSRKQLRPTASHVF